MGFTSRQMQAKGCTTLQFDQSLRLRDRKGVVKELSWQLKGVFAQLMTSLVLSWT